MIEHQMVFIGGLHRSGTSLVHEILRGSSEATGFIKTGFPQDEGQFLQTVYPRASVYGGPGRFGFDKASHIDEGHPLCTPENADKLFQEWSKHWDMSRKFLLEKSPPNIVRLRYFQGLYPGSKFIVILRHPLAVSYATRKWSKTSIPELLEHSILCYERFLSDMSHLKHLAVFRYEEFVLHPEETLAEITDWLGMQRVPLKHEVRPDVNGAYFKTYREERGSFLNKFKPSFANMPEKFEARANSLGYSIEEPEKLVSVPWLGLHGG